MQSGKGAVCSTSCKGYSVSVKCEGGLVRTKRLSVWCLSVTSFIALPMSDSASK